jgi:hypothetical protein
VTTQTEELIRAALKDGCRAHCDSLTDELRRLSALNGELLEALKALLPILDKAWDFDGDVFGRLHNDAMDADDNARAAIVRAAAAIGKEMK